MAKIIKAVDVKRDLTQLYLYVKEALKRGQTRERVKRDLLANQWVETEVDKVFIRIDTEKLSELARELEDQLGGLEGKSQDAYIVREMIERKKAKRKPAKRKPRKKAKPRKKPVKRKAKPKKKAPVKKKPRKYKMVGSKKTMTYHKHGCKWVDNIEKGKGKKAYLLHKKHAESRGFKPCRECVK